MELLGSEEKVQQSTLRTDQRTGRQEMASPDQGPVKEWGKCDVTVHTKGNH